MPLFTPGTFISTPSGERLVQELGPGDVVLNKKGVAVQIRWKGAATLNSQEIYGHPHLHPVVLQRGALAPGVPARDTAVSQNLGFDASSYKMGHVMAMGAQAVAAKKLINHRGIRSVEPITITYIHFHFDRHEMICANGAWVECFSPLDPDNGAARNSQRIELFYYFPELRDLAVDRKQPAKPLDAKGIWSRFQGR